MKRARSEGDSLPELAGLHGDEQVTPESRVTLFDLVGLALVSARRHRFVTAMVFLLGVGASVAYYVTRTPLYRVETKVLTQRPQALPSAIRSTVQDDPTHSAYEYVHRRENLLALIKQTNLYSTSPPSPMGEMHRLIRLPFLAMGRRSSADDDPLNALVKRLDRELVVATNEGTMTISIEWPDPSQAYRLVEAAIQNFLETRHLQEITAIDEVVSMLQGRVAALRDQLDKVTGETQRQAARQESGVVAEETPNLSPPRSSDEELVKLKAMVDAKERAIQDIDAFRRRRLADLQAQLDEKRGIFTDAYPSVIALRQDIEALSRESPQIVELREEHRKLQQKYMARLAQEPRRTMPSAPSRAWRQAPLTVLEQNDAVRDARFQYQQMVEQLNTAQIQLDTARAAFKYRYSVVWPAQVPTEPVSPKARKIFGLGIPGALILAIVAAALLEMRRGSVLRRWQVERGLGLPVIGELKRR